MRHFSYEPWPDLLSYGLSDIALAAHRLRHEERVTKLQLGDVVDGQRELAWRGAMSARERWAGAMGIH